MDGLSEQIGRMSELVDLIAAAELVGFARALLTPERPASGLPIHALQNPPFEAQWIFRRLDAAAQLRAWPPDQRR
jgi:hypothetical protein